MRLNTCFRDILLPLFLLSSFTITGSANSQGTTGDLRFSVRDSMGEPIPNVNVSVTGPELQGVRGTASDGGGRCVLLALPPGLVSVRLSHQAYQTAECENVRIQLGKSTSLGTIVLKESVHDLPELVVSAEDLHLDANTTTYGSNLRATDVDGLPMSRDYKQVFANLPLGGYGTEGLNVAGATGYENKYIVDGVDIGDPLFQTGSTRLPYDFIREVELKAGGYEVDNRGALGSVLNVITYSGTNSFHGTMFGFYTDNRLMKNETKTATQTLIDRYSNYDFGGSFSGPIVKDKLWFFAAYNPSIVSRDVNVPNFGVSVDESIVHSLAAKLTWNATERLRLVLTATGDPSRQHAVGTSGTASGLSNSDPYFMNIGAGGINFSLNAKYTPAENALVEASVARVTHHATGEPATERGNAEALFVDYETNAWSGGPPSWWDSFRSASMGSITASVIVGSHTARAGVEYKVNGTDNRYRNHSIVQYSPTYYEEYVSEGYQTVHDNLPSVHIQDTWQITEHLSIHAGLRWDGQYLVGSDGNVAQTVETPLQPRFGFVFLPGNEGRHRIYGSFGRFVQEFALNHATSLFSDQGYSYGIGYNHDPRVSRSGADTLWGGKFTIQPEIEGLRGQYYDDFSLGYEYQIDNTIKIGVQGLYRTIREAVDDAYLPSKDTWVIGNPGKGELSAWPRPKRDYSALIISIQRNNAPHFNFVASYVLSRNYGNYGGLFDPVYGSFEPNITLAMDESGDSWKYGDGLLPNDRTHVFKFAGTYSFDFGLTTGMTFIFQSGTPLSEFGEDGITYVLTAPRGTQGRTPAIWRINARLAYDLPLGFFERTRIFFDAFSVGSPRKAVAIDQIRGHLDANGEYDSYRPSYGEPLGFQAPFNVRLGMEVRW
jgi:hypothetical protein